MMKKIVHFDENFFTKNSNLPVRVSFLGIISHVHLLLKGGIDTTKGTAVSLIPTKHSIGRVSQIFWTDKTFAAVIIV